MKYSIAIVGNKETILGFKALGLTTINVNNSQDALEALKKLKDKKITEKGEERPKYAIIFITESLAMGIPHDEYVKLSIDAIPAIVPVPGSQGTTGYGIKRIGKMVEQAVGSDIFKE